MHSHLAQHAQTAIDVHQVVGQTNSDNNDADYKYRCSQRRQRCDRKTPCMYTSACTKDCGMQTNSARLKVYPEQGSASLYNDMERGLQSFYP